MAAEENIRVAVRLRPFLQNLKDEAGGKGRRVVQMDEMTSSVSITNPEDSFDIHKFTFDNILWSFDGFVEQADGYLAQDNKSVSEEIYSDQKQCYEEIGKEMVQNLWNGYNSTIFTFGESKSGKSWTLLGMGVNKGIVPLALTDLFKGVREKEKIPQQNGSSTEVRLSMAEVYCERVKDLLLSTSNNSNSTKFKSGIVKIREHSRKGFYIDGLRTVLIVNHEDIQQRIEEGLMNRAIFHTNINSTPSNSLTVITVVLVQRSRNHRGDEVTRMSTLEFMDLPCCEVIRSQTSLLLPSYTNSFMDRTPLRENGIDCVSKCVDSLIEMSLGKEKEINCFGKGVSKLLRNVLSGNTKSVLIATLSPSESAYETSLFVLQFAEKVRMLTTRSGINEEATSKLMRELKSENERLRKLLSLGEVESYDLSNLLSQVELNSMERDAIKRKIQEDMKSQIRENEKEVRNLQLSYEERLKPFKMEKNDLGKKLESERKSKCHIYNLNTDSQVSGKIIHIIPLGTIDFGQVNKGKENNHFITISGPGIKDHHGTFSYNSNDGKISIKPFGPNCRILVNENLIQFESVLANNDRLVFGGSQVWIYQNPKETWLEKYAFSYKLYYEYVMEEISLKSDVYRSLTQNVIVGSLSLQNVLIEVVPAIDNAKAMIEDLSQNLAFYPLILQPVETLLSDTGYTSGQTSDTSTLNMDDMKQAEVIVKVQNTADGTFCYWSISTFFDRLETVKDAYMQFLDDGDTPLKELSAFKEEPNADVTIGYSIVCLKPLAYLINIDNTLPILDFVSFRTIGAINFSLYVCDESTEEIVNDAQVFIESPDELLDEQLKLELTIQNPDKISLHFKDIYCKYKFPGENETTSSKLDLKSSNFIGMSNKHQNKFTIGLITENVLNLLLTQYLVITFFGKQRAHKLLNFSGNMPFHQCYEDGRFTNPVQMERTMAQLKIKEKAVQRHHLRLNALKALVDQSENLGEASIPVSLVKTVFEAKNQKLVDQSLEEHKESFTTVVPVEEPIQKQLPAELKALKRFSEVCCIV